MSSEMRELIAKWRAVAEKQRGMASRDNERGDLECAARMAGMAERTEYMADELEALLARTEAGAPHHPLAICPTCKDYYEVCECTPDAAPVADGAVAFCDQTDPRNTHAFAWPGTDRQTRHTTPLYTHPQDASGDAELLDWLVENEFDLVTRREDMGEDEYAIWWFVIDSRKSSWRLHTVSGHPLGSPREAIIAAMQAKEAK